MGSKIFNHLPNRIKNLANEKKVFKNHYKDFILKVYFTL